MAFSLEAIESKIDQAAAGAVTISSDIGGIMFTSMAEVMEFAKLMSLAQNAVPGHLRGQPGSCLAVCIQALEWRMSPFAVANKSYVVNDRIAYESQLIHAIVEARAPLSGRLRHEIMGEGDDRRCKVWGKFRGETEPHVYVSEPLKTLREARKGGGSPLWAAQPNVQLFYSASRTWARMYCPDVILGIYAPDELPDEPKDVTPPPSRNAALVARLQDRKLKHTKKQTRGFDADRVKNTIEEKANGAIREDQGTDAGAGVQDDPRQASGDRGGGDAQPATDQPSDRTAGQDDGATADAPLAETKKGESEIFPPDRPKKT